MAPKSLASHFNKLFYPFLLIFIHLGCFFFSSHNNKNNNKNDFNYLQSKKRKSSNNINNKLSPKRAFSSSWCFLKRVFTSSNKRMTQQTRPSTPTNTTTTTASTTSFSSPRSSQHSIVLPIHDSDEFRSRPRKRRSESRSEFDLYENPFLPLRNDIFPCPSCGEVFQKQSLLEQHQSVKHAVSELRDGDSGKNIVWIIFNTGWTDKNKLPKIHRILKIHNSQKILAKFEDFREAVKSKATRDIARAASGATTRRDERCIVDGNELLRFHCTTFLCNLGQHGNSALCSQVYCSACGIIRSGFSPKLDGISTFATSWRAHEAIPNDVEAEFAFMNVKRAMLVCRVVAGRVGCDPMVADKEDPGFDSLVGRSSAGMGKMDDDELLVFNPRAVLPCFVIVYSV
ncbi:uncharacterized protein LOC110688290 [Chenopodium quinoa]|uniref:uncharacterized protein LOC110688290 n=1 Tax=Chenopodium quinoa TaxID=63459 RepID=UPI000B790FD2|nr:uncharacterized protein LOC110688290 [Chenopodium quinoa]